MDSRFSNIFQLHNIHSVVRAVKTVKSRTSLDLGCDTYNKAMKESPCEKITSNSIKIFEIRLVLSKILKIC